MDVLVEAGLQPLGADVVDDRLGYPARDQSGVASFGCGVAAAGPLGPRNAKHDQHDRDDPEDAGEHTAPGARPSIAVGLPRGTPGLAGVAHYRPRRSRQCA